MNKPRAMSPRRRLFEYDYRPMFREVQARVSRAGLAICVLETPVSSDTIGLDGYPTFEAPRELPDAIVADGRRAVYQASFDRTVEALHSQGTEIPLAS